MKKTILMLLVVISSTNIFATDLALYRDKAYLISLLPKDVIYLKPVETKTLMGVNMTFIGYNNGIVFKEISSSDPAACHSDSTLVALLQKSYPRDKQSFNPKHILLLLKK